VLKRFCSKRGCNRVTESKYCLLHKDMDQKNKAERHRHYDNNRRDKKATTFYNSIEWEKARKQALTRDHGLCQHCLKEKVIKVADMVDHIIPIKIAWHLRVFLDNLQPLCNSCHNRKTAEDKKKFGGKV
jgi:5-methylcytosine-specific restriction protein A